MSANPQSILSIVFMLCCSVLFLVPAGILLFFFFRVRMKSNASLKWPSMPGQVVSSEVRTNTETLDNGSVRYTYSPIVQYEYHVNGQPFTGKRIHYGVVPSPQRAKAEQLAQQYTPGMAVTVYYNPEKPDEAVLERRSVSSWVGLIIGSIFVLMAACACLFSIIVLFRMLK